MLGVVGGTKNALIKLSACCFSDRVNPGGVSKMIGSDQSLFSKGMGFLFFAVPKIFDKSKDITNCDILFRIPQFLPAEA